LLAGETGLSRNAAARLWHASGLRPRLHETLKPPADPVFVDKVKDAAGLSLNPPGRAIVPRLGEEGRVRALGRTRPVIPLRPGPAGRGAHGHARRGTPPSFGALNVAPGKAIGRRPRPHRHQEFVQFLGRAGGALKREGGGRATR
jgi:hypothetical protein